MDRPSRRPCPARPRPPAGDCTSGLLYAQPAVGPSCRAPIYARLVAEWRARGRTVPARPDVQWVSLTGLTQGVGPVGR
ncbi:hypothetical protein [Streptomyces sp. NPDC058335]|uniref:hypothetical protein n=1 Tax=Streptomyces sp. NPDC058335 TaxID=3346451 RepID=UPI0036616B56